MNHFNISEPVPLVYLNVRSRSGFALQHLLAAVNFTRRCGELEAEHNGKELSSFFDEICHCCTATIFLAVASLEADVNETAFELGKCEDLNNKIKEKTFYRSESKILRKYQAILNLSERKEYRIEDVVYSNASVLIRFRNELMHFWPEWDDEQVEHRKIGDKLSGKFSLSQFVDVNTPIFPLRVMSYECCKWCISVVINFIDSFHDRTSCRNKLDLFREHIMLDQ